jgi:hypothetical protein
MNQASYDLKSNRCGGSIDNAYTRADSEEGRVELRHVLEPART